VRGFQRKFTQSLLPFTTLTKLFEYITISFIPSSNDQNFKKNIIYVASRCLHFIDKGSHPMRMERNRVQNPKLYE
jgi:hypothetical protein